MVAHLHRAGRAVLAVFAIAGAVNVTFAQEGPVATMFRADLKRDQALSLSFVPIELPAADSAAPLHVYLSAGDLERAFDTPEFRPAAAIVPTNTGLVITAAYPSTQRVLTRRIERQPLVMADLLDQIAARRKQSASKDGSVLQIGVDTFVAQLPRQGKPSNAASPFPRLVCLIATGFANGGALDQRDLFAQDRVRKGVADCLVAVDAAGATSVMMPLLGAASGQTQANDPIYEGQRLLKECRQLNAAAGIALGIRDFAPSRRSLREIGIVQWNKEITDMFRGSRFAQSAYRLYAEQVKQAVTKGIAGQHTTAADVDGHCSATFGR